MKAVFDPKMKKKSLSAPCSAEGRADEVVEMKCDIKPGS